MSINLLKTVVERFAPETVKEELNKLDAIARREREARYERAYRTRELLKSLATRPPDIADVALS